MTAPVYRHLDTKPVFMGLAFPAEWLFVITPMVVSLYVRQLLAGFVLSAVLYVLFRVATYGKPEGHIYQWLLFQLRQARGGRYSAAARGRQARFRFAPYALDGRLRALQSQALAEINALARHRQARRKGHQS